MPIIIDLEREFFKAVKDLETCKAAKEEFLSRINQISETWINNKFRMGVLGLKK